MKEKTMEAKCMNNKEKLVKIIVLFFLLGAYMDIKKTSFVIGAEWTI